MHIYITLPILYTICFLFYLFFVQLIIIKIDFRNKTKEKIKEVNLFDEEYSE